MASADRSVHDRTPVFLTAAEARQRLGIGEGAFRAAVESGRLRYIILPGGKRPRFTEADLAEFVGGLQRCLSAGAKARGSGGIRSRSEVLDFEAALKRNPATKRRS